jgi:hypothetical protein
MFIGHFAVALAAKRAASAVPLGTLFLAAQFADLLWPALVLAGIERVEILPGATAFTPLDFVSYPYSHSLIALAGWGILVGALYLAFFGGGLPVGSALAGLVLSHWILDVVTHRQDMPLGLAGEPKMGLGLWNSVSGTMAVELTMLAAGVWLYLRATRATDRTGSIALWFFVGFLLLVNTLNLFGPPPPSSMAVAGAAHAMWLLVAWGFWIDRHREVPSWRR